MKQLCLLALAYLTAGCLFSQNNFIPLRIDSLAYNIWGISIKGDTLVNTYHAAYFYDAQDSLIQENIPHSRFYFTYSPDTTFLLAEKQDTDNNWQDFSRTTRAFINKKLSSALTETYTDNTWEKTALHTYTYNNAGSETLQLTQQWNNNAWVDTYKRERTYDSAENLLEQAEYYRNNGVLDFNQGLSATYDNGHHKIQEISTSNSITGIYITGKLTWRYGNDDLLDTFTRYDRLEDNYLNVDMFTYAYPAPDTIVESIFNWENTDWKYVGKNLIFRGPHLYDDQPDSIIFYYYLPDSATHIPTSRHYFQYAALGNNRVYFKETQSYYNLNTHVWASASLVEKWYHLPGSAGTQSTYSPDHDWSVFPNPCQRGQALQVKTSPPAGQDAEVLLFDLQGRLVSRSPIGPGSKIQAPLSGGLYDAVFRNGNRLVGVSKVVVE